MKIKNNIAIITSSDFRAHLAKSWYISWPMLVIMLFEFIITLTDVYIAGRLGTEVQGAVGFVSQLYFVFIVVANAITIGTVSLVSRLHTAGDHAVRDRAITTVIIITIIAGMALALLALGLAPLIISHSNIPAGIKRYALPLFAILVAGIPFHYFNIACAGIMRATGQIRRSMYTIILAGCINAGLNVVLVFYTSAGFYGIMLSTVCGYIAASAVNGLYFRTGTIARPVFELAVIKRVVSVGWPSGLQQISWQIGSTVLFMILSALPAQTVEVIAAYTNGLRIESAIFLPAFAFNMANAVIIGNFLGAGRDREAFRGGLATAMLSAGLVIAITALVVLNAEPLARFLSHNEMVIDKIIVYIRVSMVSEPFMAWGIALAGALNGAGDTRGVMLIISGTLWLVRLPLAYVLGVYAGIGENAVWWAMNSSIIMYSIFLTRRYFRRRWLRP